MQIPYKMPIDLNARWGDVQKFVMYKKSSIACDAPFLLLFLLALQPARQGHRAEDTLGLGWLDCDVASSSLRSSAAFLALLLLVIVV